MLWIMSYEELILYVIILAINTEITVERNGIYEKPILEHSLKSYLKDKWKFDIWDRILEW